MRQKNKVKEKAIPATVTTGTLSYGQLVMLAVGVVIVTLSSLAPALKNSFINWDDNAYVFENMSLSKPFPEAISYFFQFHYFIGNYIPLTMIVYAWEYHAVQLDPPFYHAVNVAIHLANVLLVFVFIYLLSNKKLQVAALVALFFGIHPMHVESVAWVAELKDVLYSFFFLAGLITYHKYSEVRTGNIDGQVPGKRNTALLYGGTFVCFVFSVLSKPAAVVFPLVLLLLDFYSGRRADKRALLEKVPFFVVSVVMGIIAINAQQADKLIHDYYPFWQRLVFASHSILRYVVKLFLPVNLSIYYPYPQTTDGHLPYIYYLAPIGLVMLIYGIYWTLKHTRLFVFGFLFFLVNVMLVLQLITVGDAIIAERYTYISYIGLFFILATVADDLYHRVTLIQYKPFIIAGIITVSAMCSYLSFARCKVWENEELIATDLLEKFPDSRLALNNKGFILFTRGKLRESIELFDKAIRLKPDYAMAYINKADAYISMKDYDNALKTADTALKYVPDNFGVLNIKGHVFFMLGNYPEAIKYFEASIRSKPDRTNTYLQLAECYYALKDYRSEINILDAALKYEPDNFIALNYKGYAFFMSGRYADALEYFKAALKIRPDYALASENLATCTRAMTDSGREKK